MGREVVEEVGRIAQCHSVDLWRLGVPEHMQDKSQASQLSRQLRPSPTEVWGEVLSRLLGGVFSIPPLPDYAGLWTEPHCTRHHLSKLGPVAFDCVELVEDLLDCRLRLGQDAL